MADSTNIFTSLFNSLLNTPQHTGSPAIQGSHVYTYLFNILIQIYAYLASYPSMAVILPAITRVRTVIDYRLTHEYFHLHERAERQHYFQGLLTTALNAYFATMVVSLLLGQPVSFLLTSSPLYITWAVYTVMWFIPIKILNTVSRYCRWIPATAGIIFEYLLCIFTIERAMRVSYQHQPSAIPVSSIGNALDEIDPTTLLRIPSAISIPFAILCGFLMVQGNGLLAEMINIHGNFRVKTPSQVKNPFLGPGKISLNMALVFVSFVTVFVPANIFLAGAKNAPPNLLPIVQVTHNNDNNLRSSEHLCIAQQNRISQVCYQDWMLSWCPDHIPNTTTTDSLTTWQSPLKNHSSDTDNNMAQDSLITPFTSLYTSIICDTTLSFIHILGLTDCDMEQHLPPVSSSIAKQHETHQAASKSITARLHYNIIADNRDLRHATKVEKKILQQQQKQQKHDDQNNSEKKNNYRKTNKDNNNLITDYSQPFAHIYPTVPIDQVGQPLVARIIRETIGSRIDFYSRGIRGVMKTIGFGIRHVAQLIGECFERIVPIQFISHLQTQPNFECTPLSSLSTVTATIDNETSFITRSGLYLSPAPSFHDLTQSVIPPDTLFFVHVPASSPSSSETPSSINNNNRAVNIYPITFTLVKALMLLAWFVIHWIYFFIHTKFQSKCSQKLANIWWPSPSSPQSPTNNNIYLPFFARNNINGVTGGGLGKIKTPTLRSPLSQSSLSTTSSATTPTLPSSQQATNKTSPRTTTTAVTSPSSAQSTGSTALAAGEFVSSTRPKVQPITPSIQKK